VALKEGELESVGDKEAEGYNTIQYRGGHAGATPGAPRTTTAGTAAGAALVVVNQGVGLAQVVGEGRREGEGVEAVAEALAAAVRVPLNQEGEAVAEPGGDRATATPGARRGATG
jgi:hypothetical protein